MPKGQKSSATSATRKKHARKAAGDAKQELPLPKDKKKEKVKGKNKEPRVKVFIPPTKPAPVRPDPLDSLGIAKQIPPELLIVFRRLAKKDYVTKRKALEELETWVDKVLKDGDEDGTIEATLQTALPVWLHHVPSLFLSASRRIRLLAVTIHAFLLRIQTIHEKIFYFLQESAYATQAETILGSWSMAAEDIERSVANQARQAWDLVFRTSPAPDSGIALNDSSLILLLGFVRRALFDPMTLYADLNPVQPASMPMLPAHTLPRNKGGVKRPLVPAIVDEDISARKPEEEEESESDRKGRLRVGALGVLRWILEMDNIQIREHLSELLSSPLLWTGLYHGSSPPFCDIHSSSGFIGHDQPIVRKTTWNVLRSLVRCHNAYVESALLPVLSSAVLRSAWIEPDSLVRANIWEPLLKFVMQFPKAWEIDMANSCPDEEEEESVDESDRDSSGDRYVENNFPKADAPPSPRSDAFREFLTFLALSCYGSPIQGYPTVMLIISTIPSMILGTGPEAWTDLLTSFWAALDGRALTSLAPERAAGSAAFLSSLLECIVFLVKRSQIFSEVISEVDKEVRRGAVRIVVGQQMSRIWEELVKDSLRVQSDVASKVLVRTFASLETLDGSLFLVAWDPIVSSVTAACSPQQTEPSSVSSKRFTLQLSLLNGLREESQTTSEATWNQNLSMLIRTTTSVLIEQANEQLENVGKSRTRTTKVTVTQRLAEMLMQFSGMVFEDTDLSSRIDALLNHNIVLILRSESAIHLLFSFLSQRRNHDSCLSLWHTVLEAISCDPELQEDTLPSLLTAIERGDLPKNLRPQEDEMNDVANRLVTESLAGTSGRDSESRCTLLRRLLGNSCFFLPARTTSSLMRRISDAFSEKSRSLMHDGDSSESLVPLRTPLTLLSSVIDARPEVALSEDIRESLPDLFIFGNIMPRTELLSNEAKALCLQARKIWSSALSSEGLSSDEQIALNTTVRSHLRDLITDVGSRVSPEVVLQVASEGYGGSLIDLFQGLFPSPDVLEDMLRDLPSNPLDPTLAIVDPLIPPSSTWKEEPSERIKQSCDRSGLCEYARVVNALLLVTTDNRDLIRRNMWLLRHFLVLSIAAIEKHLVPSAASSFFSNEVVAETLQDISSRVNTLTAFAVSEIDDDDWHVKLVEAFLSRNDTSRAVLATQSFSSFMLERICSVTKDDNLLEGRVLYYILRRLLNNAVSADAEQWMILARCIEKQAPHAAVAIIRAVNESALEPPNLDRYRNEIAAGILAIPASKANLDGLTLLHRLALAAPDLDSDVTFLPQTRAVNFMKICQSWIASDEDINEDAESEMTLVFQYLAPILQNISGAHWEFVFDMIENNLENCSFSDPSTLVTLARTLKLTLVIQDLASTNKSLRAAWLDRERPILTLIRDFVQSASEQVLPASVPRSFCWEMALTIVQNLSLSLIDHDSLSKLVHLILDPSPEVAKMAYSLLYRAAQKRTEYLVVEAGVDTSSETVKCELPMELLQILHSALQYDETTEPNLLAYLLAWSIVFDLFDNASLRVKIGYATQLRNLDLIGSNFLPFIFDLLQLQIYGGRSRPFPLEPWSVEEFFVQFYDAEARLSPRLFASHLFYRALLNVPSLISNWWAGCKDRQLMTAIASLTTKYYSPVLISAELKHIKDPAGIAELSGENWNIKVATGIGEVSAAYTVDEQVMEIAVRLPPDYPLHGIEVREVQKLGIDEKRWRGWLLAVQQIVASQNGHIVDGLSMFKKNVMHHFENQTECAICYSIISVTELSLPKKRCKTCKNRFHAGCLFKWFNTSHTSSCPLCRSDFI